jgi:hypothetical protein
MSSLITDEMVERLTRAYYTNLGWDWEDLDNAARDHGENLAAILREFRVALEAIEPMLEKLIEERFAQGRIVGMGESARMTWDVLGGLR